MITRPTRTRLSERRRDVANLARRFAFKGWTQAAIAWHMNFPQATVSRDLAANSLLKKGTVPLGRIDMSRRNCSLERDSLLFQQAAMREFWREFPVSDFEKVRLERLQKIDRITFIAQSDDVHAQRGPLCARRELLTELDASRNRIEIYGGFGSIYRAREMSLRCIGLYDATIGEARRSSEPNKETASSRALKKYTQKRNERMLMR